MKLEQSLYDAKPIENLRIYQIVDLENLSATELYTGDIKFGANKIIIPYGNLGIEGLNDFHDTFELDRFGNLYGGHSTFNEKFHINTDILKAGPDKIL